MDAPDPPPLAARDSQPVARNPEPVARNPEPVARNPEPVARNFSSAKYTASDYAFQFITVTAGVLIALLVNGLVEARNNRNLVRDARATIAREIAENRSDLDKTIAGYATDEKALDQAIKFANEMLSTKTTKITQIDLHVNLADVSSTSWRTAERTGALSHMDYAEVQQYSRLYDLQDLLVEQQRSMLSRLAAASAILSGEFNPDDPNPKDLESFRAQVMQMRAALTVQEEFAKRLAKNYAEALQP